MQPNDRLSTTNYCLADPGRAYIVYFPEGGKATLDLTSAEGMFAVQWFIPLLQRMVSGPVPLSGGDYQTIAPPFSGVAVLILQKKDH